MSLVPSSATGFHCDPPQVTQCLCASSLYVQGEKWCMIIHTHPLAALTIWIITVYPKAGVAPVLWVRDGYQSRLLVWG